MIRTVMDMMIDQSGQQIGSYRLVRRLGMGGFASVYLGQHVRIATQQAAIKLLYLVDVDSKKFQEEAETTAALVHPNIIRLFDFDFHQKPFLDTPAFMHGEERKAPAGAKNGRVLTKVCVYDLVSVWKERLWYN